MPISGANRKHTMSSSGRLARTSWLLLPEASIPTSRLKQSSAVWRKVRCVLGRRRRHAHRQAFCLREAFGAGGSRRKQMLCGVFGALDSLQEIFEIWQRQGRVPGDLDARVLAFQFVAPLFSTRLLFYNVNSSASERSRGRRIAEQHVQTFLRLISGRRDDRTQ